MTKKITSAILALAMLLMTACGADSMNDTSKTENSSAADTTTTTVVTESNNDWTPSLIASAPADTSKKEEKNTTKTEDKNSKTDNKEGATTTTKSASNDNDSKQKQPQEQQKPQSTQAQPRTTQATAKATVKPVQTTKATTKATQKQAQAQVSVPSNLTAYQKGMYNILLGKATKTDYENVRNELLAYGKKKYPQFKINTKIHPFVDANGNYTDDAYKMKDYADSVEFYHVEEYGGGYIYTSQKQLDEDVYAIDYVMKRDVDNLLENQKRYEAGDGVVWYITYGIREGAYSHSATWVVVASFDSEWK